MIIIVFFLSLFFYTFLFASFSFHFLFLSFLFCHFLRVLIRPCFILQRRGAEPRSFLRFWSSLKLTFGEFADNHSASRGCDSGAKRAFRGLPLGHPCPMRGARTPLATEGKRPSGWEILCELWTARSLALAPFVRPCVLTRERQWLCLRVLSISPEPLRLSASALKKCFCPVRAI